MKAKRIFEEPLKRELNKFDLESAHALVEKICDAEEAGHELSTVEQKLLDRLIICIESYEKTLYGL